ncbi:hypothetical protein NBRC116494_02170 [Aurantivibrio plasticivorans]
MQYSIRKISSRILSAIMFFVIASSTYADIVGYYAEGSYGETIADYEFFDDVSPFEADGSHWGVSLGVRFNDNIGIETSYYDFGSDSSLLRDRIPPNQTLDASFKYNVLGGAVIGNWALTPRWFTTAKFGVGLFDVESEFTVTDTQAKFDGEDKDFGFYYGVGMFYRFSRTYSMKLEWQQFRFDSPLFVDSMLVNAVSVGVRYYM